VTAFEDAVRAVISATRPGDVVTYGEVAEEAGRPGAARAVGNLLARTDAGELPWWRVVTSTGRLAPGKEATQARLLRHEGTPVRGATVVDRAGK
jgi:methylated-DNA-protein-cysteine methyltransferase-like protein